MTEKINVSICIPAYNEEKNINKLLGALLVQNLNKVNIEEIIIVSSGSTDKTDEIVQNYVESCKKIKLIIQPERKGKVAAINEFLITNKSEIVVLQSADTIPHEDMVENLCKDFIENTNLGLTGVSPYPTNSKDNFVGYIVNIWWWLHREMPRFGEVIAFRNIIRNIPETVSVDEAYIEAWFEKGGYTKKCIREAIVYNKGPETIKDLITQRRRVFNGHSRLNQQIGYKVDSMDLQSIKNLIFSLEFKKPKEFVWMLGGIAIEMYARILGLYDLNIRKHNPYIWKIAKSTKQVVLK